MVLKHACNYLNPNVVLFKNRQASTVSRNFLCFHCFFRKSGLHISKLKAECAFKMLVPPWLWV